MLEAISRRERVRKTSATNVSGKGNLTEIIRISIVDLVRIFIRNKRKTGRRVIS